MANRWGNSGNCDRLFSGAPKSLQMVIAAMKLKDACSLEEKLWPPRQHIKKQRDCFADKEPSSQSYDFSSSRVWMWELDYKESWAPKNWWFWIVVLENSFERPWTGRRSNQSFLKEISPDYSLEGLMLNLKLQSFDHLMRRTDLFEKPWCWERLKSGGEGYDRGSDGWMASLILGIWVWVSFGSWWWPGNPGVLMFMGSQRVGHNWVTELNWTKNFSPSLTTKNIISPI